MCGIYGFYGFKRKGLLEKMATSVFHRGPDSSGKYTDKEVSLGMRRLSILDLKKGDQPIFNENKSVCVVYNGEIYNFKDIRAELTKKGHKFKTKTDTEIIVHAYEEYGPDCVKKFNGMFAFALWDKKKKTLFLARDRVGIKPLYYFHNNSKFVFASEIKAILQDEDIRREMNNETLLDYLLFQNILDEKTFFKGVNSLEPGHYILIKNFSLEKKKYWDIDFKSNKNSAEKNVSNFKKIFKESVERHMISDVPIGSFLSGGFDSSSVATLTSELYDKKLPVFTGNFPEKGKYDHSIYAKKIVDKINANFNEVIITPEDFVKHVEEVIYHLDEPRVGNPAISQFMVSKEISKNLKVVMTGEGGDELFAGYPVYKSALIKEQLKSNPLNLMQLGGFVRPTELPRVAYFLLMPFLNKDIENGLFLIFTKNELKKLLSKELYEKVKNYNPFNSLEKILPKDKLSYSNKIQYIYFKTYLQGLLILNDKMAMAHSVEARTPLCDNNLVDFAFSIPLKDKLHKGQLKYIIKEGMKDKLPKSVYSQPKKGFATPFSLWLRRDLEKFVKSILLSKKCKQRGVFNPKYVEGLLKKHNSRTQDNLYDHLVSSKIWSLLSIELWFRIFIDPKEIKKSNLPHKE